jgi:hypothetical protein
VEWSIESPATLWIDSIRVPAETGPELLPNDCSELARDFIDGHLNPRRLQPTRLLVRLRLARATDADRSAGGRAATFSPRPHRGHRLWQRQGYGLVSANGYSTLGVDPSEGLLEEARRLHPGIRFQQGVLPRLNGLADLGFRNVLCEIVIMHLETELIAPGTPADGPP